MIEERDKANSFDHHGSHCPSNQKSSIPNPKIRGTDASKAKTGEEGWGWALEIRLILHGYVLGDGRSSAAVSVSLKSVPDSLTRLHYLIGQNIVMFRARGRFVDWRSSVCCTFNMPTFILYV